MYIINQSMLEVCLSAHPSFCSSNSFGFLWFKLHLALQLSIQLWLYPHPLIKDYSFQVVRATLTCFHWKISLETGIGDWMHPHMPKSRLEWSSELWVRPFHSQAQTWPCHFHHPSEPLHSPSPCPSFSLSDIDITTCKLGSGVKVNSILLPR